MLQTEYDARIISRALQAEAICKALYIALKSMVEGDGKYIERIRNANAAIELYESKYKP
jgi:hypothetical protein